MGDLLPSLSVCSVVLGMWCAVWLCMWTCPARGSYLRICLASVLAMYNLTHTHTHTHTRTHTHTHTERERERGVVREGAATSSHGDGWMDGWPLSSFVDVCRPPRHIPSVRVYVEPERALVEAWQRQHLPPVSTDLADPVRRWYTHTHIACVWMWACVVCMVCGGVWYRPMSDT